ncbi:MAG: protein kinase, partial [Gemmataceae bacterium]|nr:protein kinase [Gemmataceae bacterium]
MPGAGTHPPPDELRAVAGLRLLRRIGEGGMSTVYLGYDVPARRSVAVKVLADHLAGQPEFVHRFYREAKNSQHLHHPNLVRGYAAGFDPAVGKHYLVLEYVDGPSAQTALGRVGRLPVGVAVRVGLDVAASLAFLHARSYVHRDVKPDNILLPAGGPAKLADLGLTKRLSDEGHLTAVSQGVGTSYYMPYEQAMNAALVDGRSDIFALGATLYHLLTGQVPFPGASHEEIVRGKEHDAYRPVRAVAPEVPPALAEVVARTLARDPRARFQDAAALGDALEATGLAASIPDFPPADDSGGPTSVDQPPDAPTRADLPASPDRPAPHGP